MSRLFQHYISIPSLSVWSNLLLLKLTLSDFSIIKNNRCWSWLCVILIQLFFIFVWYIFYILKVKLSTLFHIWNTFLVEHTWSSHIFYSIFADIHLVIIKFRSYAFNITIYVFNCLSFYFLKIYFNFTDKSMSVCEFVLVESRCLWESE